MERVLPPERFGRRLRNKEVNESSSLLVFDSTTGELNDFLVIRVFGSSNSRLERSAISLSLSLVKTSTDQLVPGQVLGNVGVVPP